MEKTKIPIYIINHEKVDDLITIYVSLNETIASAKKKYFNEVGSVGSESYHDHLWASNQGELRDNQTFSEIGIKEYDTIYDVLSVGGGGGIPIADISNKEGLVQGNFSKNAKEWHIITDGLNVSGICNNSHCKAYEMEVDCQIGFGTFDLVRDADRIKCPICNEEIEPTTCCFSRCQYKFEGKKKVNGKTEKVKSDWKRVEKDYEYYDPNKSGIVNWLMLIIETKKL